MTEASGKPFVPPCFQTLALTITLSMAASTSSIRFSLLSSPKLSVPHLSSSVSGHRAILSIRRRRLSLPFLDFPSISLRCAPNRSRISTSAAPVMEETLQKTNSRVSTIVDVDLGNQSYPIYIGSGLLDEPDLLQRHVHGKRVLVITNTMIVPLYLDKVIKVLTHENSNIFVESVILPDGEAYKDMIGPSEKAVLFCFDPSNCVLSIVNQLLVGFHPENIDEGL